MRFPNLFRALHTTPQQFNPCEGVSIIWINARRKARWLAHARSRSIPRRLTSVMPLNLLAFSWFYGNCKSLLAGLRWLTFPDDLSNVRRLLTGTPPDFARRLSQTVLLTGLNVFL